MKTTITTIAFILLQIALFAQPPLSNRGLENPDKPVDKSTLPPGSNEALETVKKPATDKPIVTTIPDVMPQFPGGEDSLQSFLGRNIKYPLKAKDANTQGTVYITYVIEVDGSVSDIKILRGLFGAGGKECGDEAIRVVSLMPKWKPGLLSGKPVRVAYTLPFRFK